MSVMPVPQPSRFSSQSGLPAIAGIPAESQPAALRGLEKDVLLRRLGMVHARECASTAEVLVHMIEVQRRKLYRSVACSCMYVYCQRKLRMSKAEAFRRTTAARLGRRHPVIIQAIADGRLNLTALALLSPHLKDVGVDVDEIVSAFAHKTIRETQQLLAERFPRQDAPTVMRVLVSAVAANMGGVASSSGLDSAGSERSGSAAGQDSVTELFSRRVDTTDSGNSTESMGPLQAGASGGSSTQAGVVAAAATQIASQIVSKLGGQSGSAEASAVAPQAIVEAVTHVLAQAVASDPNSAEAIELRAKFMPLSPGRHCWQFTVDQETQDLMDEALNYVDLGSQAPQDVLKQALRGFVEQHRKQKFAQVSRPRARRADSSSAASDSDDRAATSPGEPRSRHIPAEVQRAVYARDGGRCTFESVDGTRCEERRDLQFDHRIPFASGGESTVDNVRQLCREHNRHEAERAFGPEHIRERTRAAQATRARSRARTSAVGPRAGSSACGSS